MSMTSYALIPCTRPDAVQRACNSALKYGCMVHPWSWCAPVSILTSIKEKYGNLWDVSLPCLEGMWLWTRFLESKLHFKHISATGYSWTPANGGMHAHPERQTQTELLKKWIEGFKP